MKWRRVDAILAENMRRCLEDAAAAIDPSPCKKKSCQVTTAKVKPARSKYSIRSKLSDRWRESFAPRATLAIMVVPVIGEVSLPRVYQSTKSSKQFPK